MSVSYGSLNAQGDYIAGSTTLTNFNLTGTGANANFGVITYCTTENYSDPNGLSASYQGLVDDAFRY